MAHPYIQKSLTNNIRRAIEEYDAAAAVRHKGLRGFAREVAVRDLFRPILSPQYSIGTGVIADTYGEQSAQCDLIIYCPDLLPARMFGDAGVFPIEAVLATIEVKSILTAGELKKSLKSGLHLQQCLKYRSGTLDEKTSKLKDTKVLPVYRVVFAFESLKSKHVWDEYDRWQRYDQAPGNERSIDTLCVVGRGCWAYSSNQFALGARFRPETGFRAATEDHDEVAFLLYAIADSIGYTRVTRGKPFFGLYVHEEVQERVLTRPEKSRRFR